MMPELRIGRLTPKLDLSWGWKIIVLWNKGGNHAGVYYRKKGRPLGFEWVWFT